jgi:Leucine-rich repeat (LRR) protein
MSEERLQAITRELASGDNSRCEAAFEALMALPEAERSAWLSEPLGLIDLKDGAVTFHPGVSAHRIFRLRHTRFANALGVLRLAGRLEAVEGLELMALPVTALYPLARLTRLRSLTVLGDPDVLLDLRPLAGLTALQTLELQRAQVSNLKPLVGLKALQVLAIRESSRLKDARPLLAMSGLRRLDLGGCGSVRPRREQVMMADVAAVRRYRAVIARAMKRSGKLTVAERRWLEAAEAEGLLQSVEAPTALPSAAKLKRILGSQEPEVALQGLELLGAVTGGQLDELVGDALLFPWMLGAPSEAVRRVGIRLLLQHVKPERARGLAEGISLDEAGMVTVMPGVGRRGYLRGSREDPSAALALLRASGRLDAATVIMLRDQETLSDATALTGLPRLGHLRLNLGQTPEQAAHVLEGLRELPELRVLELLRAGALESLSALQNLPSIQKIRLENANLLLSLDGLRPLRDLRSLTIFGARQLQELTALRDAGELEELVLHYVPLLADLSPLAGLHRLRRISIMGSRGVCDLSPLAGLHQLEDLELRGLEQVTDISPLAGLSGLKTFRISCGPLHSLDALTGLSGLESLSVSYATGSLPSLAALSSLRSLSLIQLETLSSLSPLSSLAGLETLLIDTAPLTNLSGIASLPRLSALMLRSCRELVDVAAVSSLPVLRRLSLEYCPSLTDLSVLQDCGELEQLSLRNLGVRTNGSVYSRERVAWYLKWLQRSASKP